MELSAQFHLTLGRGIKLALKSEKPGKNKTEVAWKILAPRFQFSGVIDSLFSAV
jgi:hypothetical protein